MGPWLDSVTGWLAANPQWLAAAVFLVALVECLAIAGLIVPGTVLLFAVAVLAGSGALSLSETLLLGFLGGILGDLISYFLGRHFHQNIRRLPGLRSHPEWMAGAESYFHRYGIASLLVGRFIGPLRPMLPMVAGMCDMPFPRFIAVSLLAAAGWSLAYLLPGWATGAAFRLPLPEGFWLEAGIVAASIAVMVGMSVNSSLRRHRRATLWIGSMSLLILIGLFIGYPYLTALDQGVMTLVQEHRQPALDEIAVTLTLIGEFRNMLMFSALLVILLLVCKQWRHALFTGATLLVTALANTGTKYFFARVRPEVLSDPLTTYSMPSGHASGAFALFLSLAVLAGRGQPPRMRLTWLLIGCIPALAIALSRVYLGAHWPTDVLAGAMLASCVCAASLWLSQRSTSLNAMPFKVWWLVLPAMLAMFGFFVLRHLPHTLLRYAY
ncbi:bifunctional DedA family/phosphatase PAP2 family protein [Pseudomonas granadensis]|uniref:Bifunctional DedA family/phosphatase PAP2 family protein n=1 Tax=Pseudomonas granadensis TaxID=1421430 RepID=A0ABX7GEB2_9PSED|nr:bifunctional DedA family/phosphatase PAP2 family protein [Pseudomonas granadensis]MBN6774943.1 bifunctional DedA family/phosphatase PAP2 family protein [Pseudomonas granadensis]MBN6806555.1 bifunctional DedA family/phosphatase PAP2 family protein [Pseudomonas granadensis]MBN6833041.1 bifunctional DedA family/phosphatase PAP2 family protein [Pseudomonas granadensis]MBN6840017.1 bifunctional DedA family/phosphatase PAP2 family protein [Pseudomonas granadensis]MBN6869392.1 bifunctional DedA fa